MALLALNSQFYRFTASPYDFMPLLLHSRGSTNVHWAQSLGTDSARQMWPKSKCILTTGGKTLILLRAKVKGILDVFKFSRLFVSGTCHIRGEGCRFVSLKWLSNVIRIPYWNQKAEPTRNIQGCCREAEMVFSTLLEVKHSPDVYWAPYWTNLQKRESLSLSGQLPTGQFLATL